MSFDALAQTGEVIGKLYNLIPKPDSPTDSPTDSPNSTRISSETAGLDICLDIPSPETPSDYR